MRGGREALSVRGGMGALVMRGGMERSASLSNSVQCVRASSPIDLSETDARPTQHSPPSLNMSSDSLPDPRPPLHHRQNTFQPTLKSFFSMSSSSASQRKRMSRDKSGSRHSKRTRGFLSEDSEDDCEGDADPEGNEDPDFQADSEERDTEDSEVEEDYGADVSFKFLQHLNEL